MKDLLNKYKEYKPTYDYYTHELIIEKPILVDDFVKMKIDIILKKLIVTNIRVNI